MRTHFTCRFIARYGRRATVGDASTVFLIHAEQRDGAIECAVEVFALDTDFIVLAHDRGEQAAAGIQVILRFEDIGVAHVDRVIVVKIVDQACVLGDVTGDFVVYSPVLGFGVIVVPVQTAAEDQVQWVCQAEATRDVGTLLVDIDLLPEGGDQRRRFGAQARIPVVEVDVVVDGVVGVFGQLDRLFPGAGTDHQLVFAAEQLERATGKRVDAGLVVIVFVATENLAIDIVGVVDLAGEVIQL
ncbi:hypothetical protein D3C80_1409270 [compost metagenome]